MLGKLIDLFPWLTLMYGDCCVRMPGSELRKIFKEHESVLRIFKDLVVKRASHWVLSTSTLFLEALARSSTVRARCVSLVILLFLAVM